ncbi:MAG: DMT family transporter [Polaromonas sp.]|uniref:DMT family transporter n=1 Tax=Polaromonas sp. TaxID=1869339 RepID=UPI0032651A10
MQEATNQHTPYPYLAHWATLAFILLVSSSPAVTRLAVTQTLTRYDLMVLRCGIGGLIFLPYLLWQLRRIPRKLLAMGFVMAFFQGWGTHLTTIIGLQFAPASHASALGPGFISVWVALWGWLFYRLRPSRVQMTGLALIALGAVVLLLNSSGKTFNMTTLTGDLFFLCASAFGAIYLVYIQKHQIEPLQGAALIAVYSGLVVVPWFFLASPLSKIPDAPLPELALQIIYQGVGIGALFFLLLSYAVVRLGSQRFSMIVACVPILSLGFGRWIAGDKIALLECVAAALITSGILYGAIFRANEKIALNPTAG